MEPCKGNVYIEEFFRKNVKFVPGKDRGKSKNGKVGVYLRESSVYRTCAVRI